MFARVVLWVVLTAAGAVLVFALTIYAPVALGVRSDGGFLRTSAIAAFLGLPALAVALFAGGVLLARGRLSGRGACLALAAATAPMLFLATRHWSEAAREHAEDQNAMMMYEEVWRQNPKSPTKRDEVSMMARTRYTETELRIATWRLGVLGGVMFGGVVGGVWLSLRRPERPDPGAAGGRGPRAA
jgi:hypothetical protein